MRFKGWIRVNGVEAGTLNRGNLSQDYHNDNQTMK